MVADKPFWELEHLSKGSLLQGLERALRAQRLTLAELVAHLGEVEERRLHLAAAHGSLFSYCVRRLGMSEDEACRRIELARLARKFPALFPELASGAIGLSVALVLKPVLSEDNHRELLAAARGASLALARELVAACAPHPDAASTIRKLPEPRPVPAQEPAQLLAPATGTLASSPSAHYSAHPQPPAPVPGALAPSAREPAVQPTAPAAGTIAPSAFEPASPAQPQAARREPAAPPAAAAPPLRALQRIEPLSPQRYRVQFTADAELKRKLELARDLLRHTHPGGDFAPVVSRALDLLLDELARQRFGARKQQSRRAHAAPGAETAPTAALAPDAAPPPSVASPVDAAPQPRIASPTQAAAPPSVAVPADTAPSPPSALFALDVASAPPVTPPTPNASAAGVSLPAPRHAAAVPPQPAAPRPARVSRGSRRAVSERDALGCSGTDAAGTRCGSTAWLELDHREPAARRGSSQPENLRWLCRAHNQWAAEHAYGRAHIERAIRARRNSRATQRGGVDPAAG